MSLLTDKKTQKRFVIWMQSDVPPGQLYNHCLKVLGVSGWRLYHMHDAAVWVAFTEDGDSSHMDFSDIHKVYTQSSTEDTETGDTIVTETFAADATIANLVTALTTVSVEDYEGPNGFLVLTLSEVRALEATDTYQAMSAISEGV